MPLIKVLSCDMFVDNTFVDNTILNMCRASNEQNALTTALNFGRTSIDVGREAIKNLRNHTCYRPYCGITLGWTL